MSGATDILLSAATREQLQAAINAIDDVVDPRPWWASAANPACRPWCTGFHTMHEFAHGEGALHCTKTVVEAPLFTVRLEQDTTTDADDTPGVYEIQPASVCWMTREPLDEDLAAVTAFAEALLRAVSTAKDSETVAVPLAEHEAGEAGWVSWALPVEDGRPARDG